MLFLFLLLLQSSSGTPYYPPYMSNPHASDYLINRNPNPSPRESLHYGAPCMWQGSYDPCDTSIGLSCPYTPSPTCSCWDPRNTFSFKTNKCVGKAGEPCTSFPDSPDKLCTENAYCLMDQETTTNSRPTCVCLKGYFRSDNGTCVKYAKHSQPCQSYSPRILCEPETGLTCSPSTLTCSCGDNDDQQYDTKREMCIAKAGQRCSRTLNNCVENAKCDDKMWGFDYETGDTKIIGYRCACRDGLKVTYEGLCASDYGGPCNKSSDCYSDESLSCLNGVCQCHPISQTYDKTTRRCFNLVGSECAPKSNSSNSSYKIVHHSSSGGSNMDNATKNAKCIPNAVCLPYPAYYSSNNEAVETSSMSSNSSSSNSTSPPPSLVMSHTCQCRPGSSETLMRTCLLDYNEPCKSTGAAGGGRTSSSLHVLSRTYVILNSLRDNKPGDGDESLKCNVFEGLICNSDTATCLCADPALKYSPASKSCVAKVGGTCGQVTMDLLDLEDSLKSLIYIGCEEGSSCVEGRGRKGVCQPDISYLETTGSLNSRRGVKGSLLASQILLNNKVINDVE